MQVHETRKQTTRILDMLRKSWGLMQQIKSMVDIRTMQESSIQWVQCPRPSRRVDLIVKIRVELRSASKSILNLDPYRPFILCLLYHQSPTFSVDVSSLACCVTAQRHTDLIDVWSLRKSFAYVQSTVLKLKGYEELPNDWCCIKVFIQLPEHPRYSRLQYIPAPWQNQ